MIWQIAIEDVAINRLSFKDLTQVLDDELAHKREEILRQLKSAKKQFGEDVSDGDAD